MNDVIRPAATRHPEMTVVDWNLFSRSHPDWFQDDGLHLDSVGALMMATLIHRALDDLGLLGGSAGAGEADDHHQGPPGGPGRARLHVRLTASGGTRPDRLDGEGRSASRWPSIYSRDGWLRGTPKSAGTPAATLRATDSARRTAAKRFVLAVRAR